MPSTWVAATGWVAARNRPHADAVAESCRRGGSVECAPGCNRPLTGRYQQAIATGCQALERLGVHIPDNRGAGLATELDRGRAGLARRPTDWESADAPHGDVAGGLDGHPPAVADQSAQLHRDPALCRLTTSMTVNLALAHGHTPDSPFGYAFFGLLHSSALDSYQDAYEYGRLAMALADRNDDASQICLQDDARVLRLHQPLVQAPAGVRCHQPPRLPGGRAMGDCRFAGYHRPNRALCLFHLGTNLNELGAELERLARFGDRTRNQHATRLPRPRVSPPTSGVKHDTRCLRPWRRQRPRVRAGPGDQERPPRAVPYNVLKSRCCSYGRSDLAEPLTQFVEAHLAYVPGHIAVAVHTFYASLVAVALARIGTTSPVSG